MLPHSPITHLTHIILVEPQDSLNIGSVARAMMNLGFQHLHLVKPHQFVVEKALVTGRWAEDLIRGACVHDSLSDALASMKDVVGFSSHHRPNRGEPIPLPDWVGATSQRPYEKTALLFGREDTGLPPEAIEQCRVLVRIPSRAEYPAFNLAQSALLAMYEISRLSWDGISTETPERPSWNQFEHLDRICQEVMNMSGFHHREDGDPTATLVRNMFRRLEMSEREMRVMLALFNRIRISLHRELRVGNEG
jgi:TrmH family RNA methyltransferase